MPRSLSTTAKRALFAQETGEVFLFLLTISGTGLSEPLRFVNNTVNVTSRGNTYIASAFDIHLPDDRDDMLPQVTLTIDNVHRDITTAVRSLQVALTVVLEVILASSPNTVEAGPFNFTLRDVSYNALTVAGNLVFEDILAEPFPQGSFDPPNYPGIF